MHRIFWVAEQLFACQEQLSSAALVIQYVKAEHQTNNVHCIPNL